MTTRRERHITNDSGEHQVLDFRRVRNTDLESFGRSNDFGAFTVNSATFSGNALQTLLLRLPLRATLPVLVLTRNSMRIRWGARGKADKIIPDDRCNFGACFFLSLAFGEGDVATDVAAVGEQDAVSDDCQTGVGWRTVLQL